MSQEPGPRFGTKGVSELIVEPGERVEPAATMTRGLAQRELIVSRGLKGSGRTAHQQFALADVLAAKVLRDLTLHGIADNAALSAASDALYKWNQEDEKAGRVVGNHPVSAALAKPRENWVLRLDSYTDIAGERCFVAAFYCRDTDLFPSVKGVRHASTLVETRAFVNRIRVLLDSVRD